MELLGQVSLPVVALVLRRAGSGEFKVAVRPSDTDELIDTVFHTEGNSWTPLGESMETVLNYYKRSDDDAPIIAASTIMRTCRPSKALATIASAPLALR